MPETRSRAITWLVLAAVFLAGLACLAVLPPWEGADETAHWSYVQELADTGHAPVPGRDGISADLARYPGPRAYGDATPFDQTGFPTYRSIHAAGQAPADVHPTRYAGGDRPNWEAQHPPLYYAALVPLYRALSGATLGQNLRALRVESWIFAFAGLAIGALATAYAGPEWARGAAPLMAAWPFMIPQVFPTLARLGNDSLCLLEAGVMWWLLLRLSERLKRSVTILALGVTLGLGLLTKAFFLPIGVGVAAYLLFLGWRGRSLDRGSLAWGGGGAAASLALAAVIGGWWYVGQYHLTHDLTGGGDFVALSQQGGLAAGLARNYSPLAIGRGFAAMFATFAWTGTWSLARPPEILILGPLLLVLIPAATWAIRLPKLPPLAWAPLFLAAPLLASLSYHVFAFVALTGRGASTPGYYLHVLAAPLAFAVALGWRKGPLLPILWAYTGLFTVGAWALELSMFGGCAAKLADNPHFSFRGSSCLFDLRQLGELGHPLAAAAAIAVAILLLGMALALARTARSGLFKAPEIELTAL